MASWIDLQTVIAIVSVAASAGAAWAGVRAGMKAELNGMRDSIRAISATLKAQSTEFSHHVDADHAAQVQAVAAASRIEQKCESMCERIDELRDRVNDLATR